MSRRIPISAALRAYALAVTQLSCIAFLLTALPAAAGAEEKLVLQLHGEPQFEFAGYYAALWQGFYQEAGLNVEIKPGAPPGASPIDPVREITEGRAQFGTGTVQLLVRAAQGQSLLLLAPVFQQSGAAVYYRSDGDFSSPGALLTGRVGRVPAGHILDLELRAALNGEAIAPDRLRSVAIEPGQAIDALASRRVDAAVGSAWDLPWRARERGLALKSFSLAGYSTEFYGDNLFTLQRFARADPSVVRRFREASLKGWGYALQHPDEIAARILAKLPVLVPVSDPVGFARYQTEIARKLARYPDVALGHSNPERWSRVQQSLINIGAISRPVDLAAFLEQPAPAVRQRGDWPSLLLFIPVASGIALLVAASLLWRRRLGWGAGARITQINEVARTLISRAATLRSLIDRIAPSIERFHGYPLTLRDRARLFAVAGTTGLKAGFARWRRTLMDAASSLRSVTPIRGSALGRRPTDLNATMRMLERSLRRQLPGSVDCRFSLLPELPLCHADACAVAAAVRDLVAGAVADMPGGGDLVIGTRQYAIDAAAVRKFAVGAVGDYVRLTVKDNGAGLSAERLARIFDRGTSVRPAVAAAGELARQFGGFARVESVEGIGTAVHLYFYLAGASGESIRRSREEEATPTTAAAA